MAKSLKGIDEIEDSDWEVVDFSPTSNLPSYANLIEAINKVIVIKGIEVRETARGKVYYIHTDNMGSFYTWSKVVGRQLEEINEKYLKNGKKVKAKVVKRKNYLTLESPK